jgi:RimJ/RimL family protein N-acetyltransferase
MSQPLQAPVIETDRVILRPHRLEDFDAYQAMWADPQVTRFIGGRPRTREEAWVRFLRHAGSWSMLGYGYWAIEEKVGGSFVGEAGFHDMKREIEPLIEGVPETGWVLAPAFQGQGLATEVVRGFHDWAKGKPGFARTVCIINPENQASLAVAAKLGYLEVTRTFYHGEPTILLER